MNPAASSASRMTARLPKSVASNIPESWNSPRETRHGRLPLLPTPRFGDYGAVTVPTACQPELSVLLRAAANNT